MSRSVAFKLLFLPPDSLGECETDTPRCTVVAVVLCREGRTDAFPPFRRNLLPTCSFPVSVPKCPTCKSTSQGAMTMDTDSICCGLVNTRPRERISGHDHLHSFHDLWHPALHKRPQGVGCVVLLSGSDCSPSHKPVKCKAILPNC
jgi:hypothetical protein